MSVRLEQLLAGQDGWHVDTRDPWRVLADDGYPVAFCGLGPGLPGKDPARAERTADLIALAPDMARLLIDMGEWIEQETSWASPTANVLLARLIALGEDTT